MNAALDAAPLLTLLAFVVFDAGSALCLWGVLEAVGAQVDGTFAAAYALSKSIRLQRLPLDAASASALAKAWPALAAVRVSRLLDAAGDVSLRVKAAFVNLLPWRRSSQPQQQAAAPKHALLSSAATEAKRLADEYGLAYMAAKNVIGPVSIAAFYALLTSGSDLASRLPWLAAATTSTAGVSAGRLCLASWVSTLFFPLVVLSAAHGGLWLHKVLESVRRHPAPRVV